jgi:hypothetical protein
MNRVAVRIDKVVSEYKGDPSRTLRGFAENVAREDRTDRKKQVDIEWVEQSFLPEDREEKEEERKTRDREDACVAKCKAELTDRERNVFWRYFQDETKAKVARKKLAAELGVTANALRIKAHRVGLRLRHCLETCLEKRGKAALKRFGGETHNNQQVSSDREGS